MSKSKENRVTIIPAEIESPSPEGTESKRLRVAAYCRVSTNSEEQLSNYEAQLEYYMTKVMQNPQWSLVKVYADQGITGTSTKKRKEFQKMIRACKAGKIDLIITKSVSRFCRNTLDCLEYVRELKGMGVGVYFEKENVNTLHMDNEMVLTFMMSQAQAESESLSGNIKWGHRKNFKDGKVYYHFKNFLGYRESPNGEPEIDPAEAEIVRRIFNRYLLGDSVWKIKNDLHADGIKTLHGKETWKDSVILSMLKNEKYIGDALLQKTFVFIDEVQGCKGFEKAVDSLFIRPNVDVYITGSNAYMLSGELATLLSGRYITIDMLPLSFREYCKSEGAAGKSKQEQFNDYLRFGSFPYVSTLPRSEPSVTPYLEGIYNTILVKDVAQREGITDVSVLESIVRILASSMGSPISTKKIADTLCSAGRKISVNTVDRYLRALTDSYLFYAADRYDIKGRQYLKTLGKYYLVDIGLRNFLLSGSASDLGHLIGNVVYLELRRRGCTVNIGKLAEKEVDFVASTPDGSTYYQVSATVLDENTLKRELEPLQKISDNHPKVLLTLDEIGAGANYDGIRQLNLISWLLGE